MDPNKLKKYHGIQSSIIPLSSQYYFYLASWDKTPTDFPGFTNFWLITPDDHRMLFSDPPESSKIVCIYHYFNEIIGSCITVEWADEKHLKIDCNSKDGLHHLKVDIQVKETLSSKILLKLASGPPTPFRVSKPMVGLSNLLINRIIAKTGSAFLGVTETGQPFYHGETEKIFHITQGSAQYNKKDLGMITNPTWPITFGDAVPFHRPILKLGNLRIPFEQEMLERKE